MAQYIMDATCPSYQVDAAHAPDKQSLWDYPMEDDGWTHAHNAIRYELAAMSGVLAKLGSRPLSAWEIESMQAWWKGHAIHIHDHHHNEDGIFIPFMNIRCKLPAKLEKDHEWLVAHMKKIAATFAALGKLSAADLAPLWAEYDSKMRAHLLEEEAVCIPLLRAYFTPQETGKVVESILSLAPAVAMGSFFYSMGGQAPVMRFMKQEGIPFFVWYIQFAGQLATYEREMACHVVALMTGYPPKKARSAPSFAVLLNLLLLAAVLYLHVLAPMLAPAEVAPPPPKKCILGLFCR